MLLFIIGLVILFVGGYFYSKYVESQFGPDDRETPAVKKADGIDYVGMDSKRNWLINLLNIAGTGPILGPIQGILFGPIAFIAIPLGNVFAGAVHDYFTGMISMRNGGAQVPKLVGKYLGNGVRKFYNVIIAILLLLTGVVFVYTPGDLIVNDVMGKDLTSNAVWVVYGIIFVYYILSTVLPIDKLIGKIYPVFGLILLLASIGIFGGILVKGNGYLAFENQGLLAEHPVGQRFIPSFFITVACGIMSGFHGSQVTLVSRTVQDEREGIKTFYSGMVAEGFIAMSWAAGALVVFSKGIAPLDTSATLMVGEIAREFLGNAGGYIAIIGVIVLPITSGDTAFRSLRLIISEEMNIDQREAKKRAGVAAVLFIPAIAILYFAKTNPNGFNLLWRYFGFTNQFVAIFALGIATSFLYNAGKNHLITLIPGMFYTMIVFTFILNADAIGFGLPYNVSLIAGIILAIGYGFLVTRISKERKEEIDRIVLA